MADRIFRLDRRELLAGIGAAVVSPALSGIAAAQGRRSLTLQAKAGVIALRPGQPDTAIWSLQGAAPDRITFRYPGAKRAQADGMPCDIRGDTISAPKLNRLVVDF